ncbi:multidrug resistance-associated protein 1-like [Liolophura sinensis]|uniref:multidrug resistance-associated protein 1-like n=1 Tax=Liolophura sinensis TaxID=3198878 RepID=UPI00315900C8
MPWSFCAHALWDGSLTWNSSYPEFTECFQNTVLVLVPCGWLWVTSPFYLCYIYTRSRPPLRISRLSVAKCVLGIVVAIFSVVKAVQALSRHTALGEYEGTADIISPFIRAATMIFAALLVLIDLKRGSLTSGMLWIFWFLEVVAGISPFYTDIIQQKYEDKNELVNFVIFYIDYAFVVVQFVLHCFAEKPRFLRPTRRKQSPETSASFSSLFSFSWVTPFIVKGYKKTLEEDDVWDLVDSDKCHQVVPKFERVWYRELDKCKDIRVKSGLSEKVRRIQPVSGINQVQPEINISQDDFDDRTHLLNGRTPTGGTISERKQRQPSLLKVLAKVYGKDVCIAHFLKLIKDLLTFVNPILLRMLIEFTDSVKPGKVRQQTWRGYTYAVAITMVTAILIILEQQCFYRSFRIGMRIRAALISAIYKKALSMNNLARKESSVGEIVNLMSVDAYRFEELLENLWAIWSGPLLIILSIYFLYQTVGPSVFAGVGIIVVLFPINALIMAKAQSYQEKQMTLKDGRIKLMNEVLNGIKMLKLYAWELSFREKILAIRNEELKVIRKAGLLQGFGIFSWTLAPYLVSLATFATYIYASSDHFLDAQTAFVAISLLNILRFAINLTPTVLTDFVRSLVSLRRITKFLCHEDLDLDAVQKSSLEDDAVVIENGTFSWDHTMGACLKGINVHIEEGGLVAVVGQVGAGKSSLLSAMLGEMNKVSGRINVKGKFAYVPQQAWIQNATVQDNILFGAELRPGVYRQIIEACALGPDLDILPAKDQTEIGEKGINLSGGQKQRVSLARAVYNDADVYLMDDPLSAVDSHVGKHIFDHVMSSQGMLKGKTRVLVTSGVHWLPLVDKIVVLVDGEISEVGSYDELMTHDGAFAQFLKAYHLEKDTDDGEEDENSATCRSEMLDRIYSVTSDKDRHEERRERGQRKFTGSLSREGKLTDKEPSSTGIQDRLIDEETAQVGAVSWKVYLTYFRALGVPFALLLCGLYVMYDVSMIFSNIWLSHWTTDAVLTNRSLPSDSPVYREKNDYYLGIYGGLGIGQGICVVTFSFLMAIRMTCAASKLHADLLMNVLRSPMAFFDTTPIGRIVNRFSKDIDSVDEELSNLLGLWLDSACFVLSILVIIAYSTPIFLSLIMPLCLLYYIIQRFYISTSRQLKRLESKTRSPIFSHFSETISGASVIRAFGAERRFIEEQQSQVDHNHMFYFAGVGTDRWLCFFLEMVGNMIVLAAGMFAVSQRGVIQGGLVGLSVSYALEITEALTWLARLASAVETKIVSVERINEYTEAITEAQWYDENRKPPHDWPDKGVIRLENYATRYRPGLSLVLKGITADIQAGERVGVVGRTGAGKSSLTHSLFRLIEPEGGAIVIDGQNIADLGLHDLRSRITILPQDPVLFSGTLRMNLDPFDRYHDDRIWQALEHAHLKGFVEGLPERLQHECGEGGQNLSVGQKQLVCLARTLLRKTKILVLDEATAAVDMETDDLIQATIREEFKDCTILTIAHRLNTVMDYDRILVLDNGMISEFDSPSVLLQNKVGLFYSLARNAGLA